MESFTGHVHQDHVHYEAVDDLERKNSIYIPTYPQLVRPHCCVHTSSRLTFLLRKSLISRHQDTFACAFARLFVHYALNTNVVRDSCYKHACLRGLVGWFRLFYTGQIVRKHVSRVLQHNNNHPILRAAAAA